MTDQHGRPWHAEIEKDSGYPTGPVRPRFRVPQKALLPPQKYLVFNAENPARLTVNYDLWIKDLETANREWEENRILMGVSMHGTAFDANGKTPIELLVLLGPKPMSAAPVLAMKQGNKWALGEVPPADIHGQALAQWTDGYEARARATMPPEAKAYFPEPMRAPAAQVFSGDVFTTQEPETLDAGKLMAQRMEEIQARVPEHLKGAAKNAWILREMKGEPQPAEV
jgi:hypothetical protein